MTKTTAELLKDKREYLIQRFVKGKEDSFLEDNAMLLDEYFQDSFGKSVVGMEMDISKNPYAIVALGGYGRREQCIYSDVDILFLFEKKVPRDAERLVQEIIYPLWDIGMDVGHCTRSISECLKLAKDDLEVLTSLLDSRFLCGMSHLYTEFNDKLCTKVLRSKPKKIMNALIKGMKERHDKLGDSTYLLEPNLKEGKGGLRDYHALIWASHVISDLKTPDDLIYNGFLSPDEYQSLTSALSFIFNVRNRLHYMAGRKSDQLYFEYQTVLAKDLKFAKEKGQMPVERFLSQLHEHMEYIKQYSAIFFTEYENTHSKGKVKNKIKKKPLDDRIVVLRNMLHFTLAEEVFKSPILLVKIFEESARCEIPISAEARRIIKEFSSLIDSDFLKENTIVDTFEIILLTPAPTFNVLNEMLITGILSRLIPEFRKIENRVQFDKYHLYPVDKHSLRTVQILKGFRDLTSEESHRLYGKIYREISHRLTGFMWAALLHDIGKGKQDTKHSISGAKIAKKILTRLGYDSEDIDTVAFLVKEHLLLSKIATRRDISDEETAIYCARKIKDPERLKMLYLLSVADAMATGPKAWSEWFSSLLRDLFLKILSILVNGELATEEAVQTIEKKKSMVIENLRERIRTGELESVIENMSPRYLLYTDKEDILKHVELYEKLGQNEFVWTVEKSEKENTRTVTLCGKDHPGLFSKIAGVLTFNDLDILDAQIFTWRNNIALDILKVKPPPDKIFEEDVWIDAEKNLKDALSGELDLTNALREKIISYRTDVSPTAQRPHRVKIDNTSSSFFSIIDVFTYDYKGLLYKLTDTLYTHNLDIWVAKIATKADQVVDVFYVRNVNGEKISNEDDIHKLIASIHEVLLMDHEPQPRGNHDEMKAIG